MENRIETQYAIKVEEALRNLRAVDETLGTIEDATNRAGNNQSFNNLSRTVVSYNRVLSDGSRIYRQVDNDAKAYRAEIDRLTKAEKELIKAQIEFKNGADYDEVTENLELVRKRIGEINAGLEKTGETSKKSGGFLSNLSGVVKGAAGLLAGFFAVDKLVDVEGQIVDATRTYERYYAVLRNGFSDENKAAQSLELIYNFASKTPYSVNELTESFIQLSNRGFTPTEQQMRQIGDLAASQGKSFNQLVEGVLDATTGEYERLKEFGINAQTVGDKVTLSFKDQEATINKFNKGAIKDAILAFGDLKGVAGSMGAVSQTLDGQISNLGDSWEQLLTSLGRSQGFLSNVIGLSNDLLQKVKSLVDVPIEQKIRSEQTELNTLVKSLVLASDGEGTRSRLITEITQKYPSFLKYIDIEKASNEDLIKVLSIVNQQYDLKIQKAVQSAKIAGYEKELTKIYEDQAKAFERLQPFLKSKGLNEAQFKALPKPQQEALLSEARDSKRADIESGRKDAVGSSLFGKTILRPVYGAIARSETQKVEDDYKAVLNGNQREKDLLASINDTNKTLIDYDKLGVQRTNERIKVLQDRNAALKKSGKLTTDQRKEVESNGVEIKALKASLEAQKDTFSPSVGGGTGTGSTGNGTGEKPKVKDREEELADLVKLEQKYNEELAKITLDAENVRLQMFDKDSKAYLDAKLEYDQKVIDAEEKKYKDLYQIQLENELLAEELQKRKGKEILESELETLKEQARIKATQIISDPKNARNYENSSSTTPQKNIIDNKREFISFQYSEGIKKLEEKAIKEQQERLELQNSLLGEGIEKQTKTITEKYAKLIEKYKENQDIVKQLEAKRNLEISEAGLNAGDKTADTKRDTAKTITENRKKPTGGREVEFELAKKADLLQIDIDFYRAKIELLKNYTQSEAYITAVANGQISKEQKDANDKRLKDLETSLNLSQTAHEKLAQTGKLTSDRYKDGWELVGDAFKGLTGKVLKFSEDADLDNWAKKQVTASLQMIRDGLSQVIQMQIENSDQRIQALDDEISQREQKVNEEQERYKQGLANSYEAEKDALAKKKEERNKEAEHRKKLQKEQAVIDSLTIISSNAVTVANTIAAAAEAFKAHSGIPFVGIALGLAAVATIIGTIASVNAKVKSASRLRYGGKYKSYGRVKGNLHEVDNGIEIGDTGIFVEGDEYVNRREVSNKNPDFFEAINDGSFENLSPLEQRKMLKPFGLKVVEGIGVEAKVNADNLVAYKTAKERQSLADYHYKQMALNMAEIAKNTGRIPEHQIVSDGDEILKFNPSGKIIEVIQKDK